MKKKRRKRMVYPNNYYPQLNPYQTAQYQNFQAQQRQEQLNQLYSQPFNCNYVRDENEARNWQVAPGNHLVFENQNGQYFYTKSLGFAPNEKPVFAVFKREDFVEQSDNNQIVEQNPFKEEFEKYKSSTELEMNNLRQSIEELKQLFNQKPHFNKKGGRD